VRKLLSSRRGRILVVLAVVGIVFGGGGAAFAYFTSTGSGTGSATVGTAGTWNVTQASTSGTIYPGSGSSTIVFNVKNNSNGDQSYATETATVNSDSNGYVTTGSGNTSVTGCKASWFSASISPDSNKGTNIASNATVQVSVQVSMPADSADNQNACQGQSPDVTLNIG